MDKITLNGNFDVKIERVDNTTILLIEEVKKEIKGYKTLADVCINNITIDCGVTFNKITNSDLFMYETEYIKVVITEQAIKECPLLFMPFFNNL